MALEVKGWLMVKVAALDCKEIKVSLHHPEVLSALHTANLSWQTHGGKLHKVGKCISSLNKLLSNHNTVIFNMANARKSTKNNVLLVTW